MLNYVPTGLEPNRSRNLYWYKMDSSHCNAASFQTQLHPHSWFFCLFSH